MVANCLVMDRGSTTGANIYKLEREAGIHTRAVTLTKVKDILLANQQSTLPVDQWRLPLLERLLAERREMEVNVEDTKNISSLIDSLCSS